MTLHALTALLFSAAALTGTRATQEQHQRIYRRAGVVPHVAAAARHHDTRQPDRLGLIGLGSKRQVELAAAASSSASGGTQSTPSQMPSPSSSSPSISLGPVPATSTGSSPSPTSTGSPSQVTSPPSPLSSSSLSSSSSMTTTAGTVSVPPGPNGVPPLSFISSGMPSGTSSPLTSTFSPGATPPISGVPPLPTKFIFNTAQWPPQDKVPDTTSPEVQKWLEELEGFDIPTWSPTTDGTCAGNPSAVAEAKARGWWTCGGTTRDTDITACPKKYDWGVSFDDGPSPWSKKLLNYLGKENIKATFFVVGSRVIERPDVLIEEYMAGHEISVHTWSHRPLTSLSNEQIVAELGWTRKAIQTVLGVTPTTMRPPYGDIDDRVRAISLALGMVQLFGQAHLHPVHWRVAGGLVDATTSFNTFQGILGNASTLPTGFIVLQHDLYEVTVDLAVGYTLNAALTHNPPFSLKPIGACANIPATNLYAESNKNGTFPYTNHTVVTSSNSNSSSGSSSQANVNSANGKILIPWMIGAGCAVMHLFDF
ncbi:hypothetical protein B0F90DRAFT_1695859 [Multifurca ochricompacta]|uniref:chitin deacetylase n=1 Tax=Multifurca ochricompacta TaxID=376703 RepID=A0AAD4M9L7_9AGAM|nr:hypothetical protein B0F90DRAFT_1695859 [Multifurca ochricompacta]